MLWLMPRGLAVARAVSGHLLDRELHRAEASGQTIESPVQQEPQEFGRIIQLPAPAATLRIGDRVDEPAFPSANLGRDWRGDKRLYRRSDLPKDRPSSPPLAGTERPSRPPVREAQPSRWLAPPQA